MDSVSPRTRPHPDVPHSQEKWSPKNRNKHRVHVLLPLTVADSLRRKNLLKESKSEIRAY